MFASDDAGQSIASGMGECTGGPQRFAAIKAEALKPVRCCDCLHDLLPRIGSTSKVGQASERTVRSFGHYAFSQRFANVANISETEPHCWLMDRVATIICCSMLTSDLLFGCPLTGCANLTCVDTRGEYCHSMATSVGGQ